MSSLLLSILPFWIFGRFGSLGCMKPLRKNGKKHSAAFSPDCRPFDLQTFRFLGRCYSYSTVSGAAANMELFTPGVGETKM